MMFFKTDRLSLQNLCSTDDKAQTHKPSTPLGSFLSKEIQRIKTNKLFELFYNWWQEQVTTSKVRFELTKSRKKS